jgi:hypothetical protein
VFRNRNDLERPLRARTGMAALQPLIRPILPPVASEKMQGSQINPKNPELNVSRRITLEDAARAMLGRENDDEQEKSRSGGGRSKITLPRVAWLEKPGPEWIEPPKQARRRAAGRK